MRLFALGVELGNVVSVQRRHDADPREERRSAALDHQKQSFIAAQVKPASSFGAVPPFFTHMSIGPLIAVCCQATILPLSSDTSVAIAPSELVRLRRRSDRGWLDGCLAGLAIDVVVGFVGLG
jgi:hypothetical protein